MQNGIIKKILKAVNPLSCEETRQQLEKFWKDDLSAEEEERVREHVIVCEECLEPFISIVAETAESGEMPAREDIAGSDHAVRSTTRQTNEGQKQGRLWLGDECYELRATKGDPTLLQVENLAFVKLRKKREQDLREPSSCKVQIEHAGKTLVTPISEFVDVGERLSYKLAAADSSSRTDSAAEESTAPLLKYRCEIEPCCVEVFVDENGFVYLHLEEIT